MTQEVYAEWRASLTQPKDSLFYFHKDLDRIILGLAIFVISTKSVLLKLGKAEMLGILHLQVPDLVTYWIDNDGEGFKTLFPMVMKVAEAYVPSAIAAEKRFPSNKKAIRNMVFMLGHACSCGGDMNDSLADELLDDLSTDDREIYSDKIRAFALKLQLLVKRYGMDIPVRELEHLNGWA